MLSRRDLIGRLAAAGAMGLAAGAGRAVAKTTGIAPTSAGAHTPTGADFATAIPVPAKDVESRQGFEVGHLIPEGPQPQQAAAGGPGEGVGSESVNHPAPWDLLRPMGPGSAVKSGWHLADLGQIKSGSFVVTLRNESGRSQRVHVCRNDGSPAGLVFSDRFDMVVMNGGQGDLPTDEGLAQAIAEIAHVLAANEGNRRHAPVLAALLPHQERIELFGSVEGARLR